MAAIRLLTSLSQKVHRNLINRKETDILLIKFMTWNDLCNYTFMFYVIICPFYRFVQYEMKTK